MNRKNRLAVWLCLVLTVLMVVSAIPAGAISVSVAGVTAPEQTVSTPNSAGKIEVNTGNPALDDSVPVGNPGEGYTPVGTAIKSTEDFNNMDPKGKYYLAADIAVSKTYAGFAGVFDGNGHTVTVTVPLFKEPQSATIKNLVVEGNVATVNNGNVGAVASGTSFDCNFFNILNKANVTAPAETTETEHRAAGIAGRTNGYTIFERCTNEGTISGTSISAGITSLASADDASEAVFINCVNKGVVTTSRSSAAGITAAAECPQGIMLFYNCRNEAAVTGQDGAGGIIGYTTNSLGVASVRLYGCTNAGVITAVEGHAGGMIGSAYAQGTIENCTNEVTGKIYAGPASTNTQRQAGGILGSATNKMLISGCKNYADIEGAGQSGGISGTIKSTDAAIQNCQNYGAVTSRNNYVGGITARIDTFGDLSKGETNNVIADCTNEGNVSSYKDNVAGIVAYSQTPVTIIRCTNKGNVGARPDTPDNISVFAGGIASNFACPVTIIDCTNNGNVTGKANYTVSDGVVTAQGGGTAGGILASSGDATRMGVTRVIGCVNTGAVKSGESRMDTVPNNTMYAGGIVGYQYGGGTATYLVVSYCINTGDVTAASDASYVLGYANLPYAIITCNVLAGKLTSTCFPTGVNANGSSVLNALFWNNASTLPEAYYSNNWVVRTFTGTLINNVAQDGAGNPVGMGNYAYLFEETDDPFEVMEFFIKGDFPRDAVTQITSADEFLAMSPIGNYKLANDITLDAWYEGFFLGTFDGDNHTITLNGKSAFDRFCSGAVIRNVILAGTAVSNDDTTGALGRYGGATFINIRNTANVTSVKNAGGIIGSVSGIPARFENCVNTGTISSTTQNGQNAGGICGMVNGITTRFVNCTNSGTVTAIANAGGMAGYTNSRFAQFVGCVNNGTISGSNRVGGIVGESQTGNSKNVSEVYVVDAMYEDCVNTGKITSTSASGTFAGGIEGYNGTSHVTLKNCFNSGDVTGPSAGGVIGDARKGFIATGVVNTGNITATKDAAGGIYNHGKDDGCLRISLTGAINTGTVKGVQAGGIAGQSNQIAGGKNHVLKSCINLGDVDGTGVNVGGLVGYMFASGNILPDIQDCIVAGTVTTTADRAGALIGYANTNKTIIKNNVIVCPVSAKVATHVFFGTGAQALSTTTDDKTTYTNIAQNNMVKPGIAMYDTQTGHGAVTIPLGKCSSGTVAINDFAIDSTLTANTLLAAGIAPTVDGKYSNAFRAFFGGTENNTENKVAVYNAAGELVATVSTLTEAGKYLTEGATVKLLANYYAGMYDNLYGNGISYTLDGNGFGFYSANTGKYMLNFSGSGSVNVVNLEVYAQGNAVRVGLNRRSAALNVTFTNAKIYAGSANENGCIRSTCHATALFNVAPLSVVEIKGAQTAFKNAFGVQILCNDGVMNIEDGTYTTHEIALETWGQDPVVNVNGGTFSGDRLVDTSLITSGRGTININGGKFTYTGMCVMRVLGGKTKNEAGADNTITTATNARLNVYGGEFVLAAGYESWWSAVVRCGGGTTYGSVLITGGTFVNQKTENSAQVIFKNNTCSSLTITGGKFLANAKQTYFVRTNGCADVVLEDGYRPTDSLTARATSAYSGTYTYDGASYKIWTLYGATDGKYAMTTESGAQVRMTAGSTGLRFISTITADKVAAAKALAGDKGSVSFGTVIAPLDYVLRADAFTMAALDGALTDVAAGKRYVDIEAVDGLTEDAEGNVKIRAALTNIKAANLTRAFAAVSYVKVVDATGNATYYYSEFDAVENVRAIRQVAEAALADTKETQEGAYIYAILGEEGTVVAYSRYSESERAVLKTFVA